MREVWLKLKYGGEGYCESLVENSELCIDENIYFIYWYYFNSVITSVLGS